MHRRLKLHEFNCNQFHYLRDLVMTYVTETCKVKVEDHYVVMHTMLYDRTKKVWYSTTSLPDELHTAKNMIDSVPTNSVIVGFTVVPNINKDVIDSTFRSKLGLELDYPALDFDSDDLTPYGGFMRECIKKIHEVLPPIFDQYPVKERPVCLHLAEKHIDPVY